MNIETLSILILDGEGFHLIKAQSIDSTWDQLRVAVKGIDQADDYPDARPVEQIDRDPGLLSVWSAPRWANPLEALLPSESLSFIFAPSFASALLRIYRFRRSLVWPDTNRADKLAT
jgi:hypothetical protein